MFQWRVLQGDWKGELGLALAHPLYILLCQPLKLFGLTHLPFLMNAFSGLWMAIAVANVYLLGYWFTGRHWPAVLAAATLGLAHAAWWLATIAEVYTLSLAGFTGELLLLVWLISRPRGITLMALAMLAGLGITVHNFALLALPVYAVTAILLALQRRIAWWTLPVAVACWAVGASLYLAMIAQEALAGAGWLAALRSALVGQGFGGNVMATNSHALLLAGGFIGLSWPLASLLPVLVGWWGMARRVGRGLGSALGAIAAIHVLFAVRYDVPDQFTFMLPSYVMFALGSAVGLDQIGECRRWLRRLLLVFVLVSLAATPVLYGAAPSLLTRAGVSLRGARHLPGRDEIRYWITPWKMDEHSAERFARGALKSVDGNAVILADDTPLFPLRLSQALTGVLPEVRVDWTRETGMAKFANQKDKAAVRAAREYLDSLSSRPLYVVTSDKKYLPESLSSQLEFREAEGRLLYRASPKPPAASQATQP